MSPKRFIFIFCGVAFSALAASYAKEAGMGLGGFAMTLLLDHLVFYHHSGGEAPKS